jgi:hypothetical protein
MFHKILDKQFFNNIDPQHFLTNFRKCWTNIFSGNVGSTIHYKKLFNPWQTFCDVLREHEEHCVCDVFLYFVTYVYWWILEPRTLRRFVKFVAIRSASTTYSCFSSRMCTDGCWSPKHCDDLLYLSQSGPQHWNIWANLSRPTNTK